MELAAAATVRFAAGMRSIVREIVMEWRDGAGAIGDVETYREAGDSPNCIENGNRPRLRHEENDATFSKRGIP